MQHHELIDLGSRLSSFVVGTEGNISKRLGDDGFVIKASGKSIKDMDDGDFVYCKRDGKPVSSGKPSMEVGFHAFIYQHSNYNFIAHTHPVNTLKILCTHWLHNFAKQRLFPDQVVFNGTTACVVPYATPGKDLVDSIKRVVSKHESCPNLFLLENHGIICCANSVQQAVVMTEICEKAAEVFVGAMLLSYPVYLRDEEVSAIQRHDGETYRREMS